MKEATPKLGTSDRILEAALAKEKEAQQFYSDLLAQTNVEFIRNMLETLRDEECRHVRTIESMIRDLNLGHVPG